MDPEPDGSEGLADVRVLQAALKSLQTKLPQKLEPFGPTKQIEKSQEKKIGMHKEVKEDDLTNAKPPSK